MKKFLMMGVCALALVACATPEPGSPESQLLFQKKQMEAKTEAVEQEIERAPDWFYELPGSDSAVYSAGTSVSPDLQLSVDKAVLNAKRVLADRIEGELNSMTKEFLTEIGQKNRVAVVAEVNRTTKNVIAAVGTSGYRVKHTKVLPEGPYFRTYVLLEYPMGEANRVLVDKLSRNRAVTARRRAKKSFKELDKEVKDARTHREKLVQGED